MRGLIEVLFLKFGTVMFREQLDFEDSIYDSDNEKENDTLDIDDSMYSEGSETVQLRGEEF